MERRQFLKFAAAGLAAPYVIPRGVLAAPGRPGANDRIAAGVIGTGGRIASGLRETPPAVQIPAWADCDRGQMAADSRFGKVVSQVSPDEFAKWPRFEDYRAMLDQQKLD